MKQDPSLGNCFGYAGDWKIVGVKQQNKSGVIDSSWLISPCAGVTKHIRVLPQIQASSRTAVCFLKPNQNQWDCTDGGQNWFLSFRPWAHGLSLWPMPRRELELRHSSLYTDLRIGNNEPFPSTVASPKPKAPFNFPSVFFLRKRIFAFLKSEFMEKPSGHHLTSNLSMLWYVWFSQFRENEGSQH